VVLPTVLPTPPGGTSHGTSHTSRWYFPRYFPHLPVVLPTPADGRDMQCSDGSRYVDETETARKYSLKSGLKTGQNARSGVNEPLYTSNLLAVNSKYRSENERKTTDQNRLQDDLRDSRGTVQFMVHFGSIFRRFSGDEVLAGFGVRRIAS
jgi:hypothetical protein